MNSFIPIFPSPPKQRDRLGMINTQCSAIALARRCAMNTLGEAVQEYLSMRRSLGFKLREDGFRLFDFVAFMERRKASYITHELALAWAQSSTTPLKAVSLRCWSASSRIVAVPRLLADWTQKRRSSSVCSRSARFSSRRRRWKINTGLIGVARPYNAP